MKQILRLATLLTALITALLTISCSQSDDPAPTPSAEVRLTLTINVDEESVSSRAPTGDYDPGVGYENYIGISEGDFAVYLLDEVSNTVLANVSTPVLTVQTSVAPYKTYRLDFGVSSNLYGRLNGRSVKVLFLANWGTYPNVTVGTALTNIVEGPASIKKFVPFGSSVSQTERIPMFGIRRYDNIELVPDEAFRTRLAAPS